MTAFAGAPAAHLPDRDYADVVLAGIERARRRVWVDLFLFDARPALDVRGRAMDLVMALVERHHSGVDVRVLLTGALRTPVLGVANVATGLLLDGNGVPHRRVFAAGGARRGTHAKVVVVDDLAVVGSQNWAEDAFSTNVEDAVVVGGPAVDLLATDFLELWATGRGSPDRAAP